MLFGQLKKKELPYYATMLDGEHKYEAKLAYEKADKDKDGELN